MEFKFNSSIFKNSPEDQQRLYGDKYDPGKTIQFLLALPASPRKTSRLLLSTSTGPCALSLKLILIWMTL